MGESSGPVLNRENESFTVVGAVLGRVFRRGMKGAFATASVNDEPILGGDKEDPGGRGAASTLVFGGRVGLFDFWDDSPL